MRQKSIKNGHLIRAIQRELKTGRVKKEIVEYLKRPPDERIVIWCRDNESCQMCNNNIAFEEMHADHIKPHSEGGKTTLDNTQALCQQ